MPRQSADSTLFLVNGRCPGERPFPVVASPTLRRAGARSTVSSPSWRVTMSPARVRRTRRNGLAARSARYQGFQLSELDRAFVTDRGDCDGHAARSAIASGSSKNGAAASFTRPSGGHRADKLAGRGHGRPSERGLRLSDPAAQAAPVAAAVKPFGASFGISARIRARVKRGSRFVGSSAYGMPSLRRVAIRRDFGIVEQRADKHDVGLARDRNGRC